MTPLDALAILGSGIAAGFINAVVGSGSLITFPVLMFLGYPNVVANISNNVGLVPGSAAGVYGYRRELAGQRKRLIRLGSASALGALLGSILLLALPASAFTFVVPVLIVVALVLVVLQPFLNKRLADRDRQSHGGPVLWLGVFGAGVYGGYFGAAQGVILLALLGIFLSDRLQRINGVKNVLAMLVNGTAAILFIAVSQIPAVARIFHTHAHIDWMVVLCIAVGSTIGGLLGGSIGRLLPAVALRVIIVVVGLAAIVKMLA